MKTLKKTVCILLLLCLCLSAAACGAGDEVSGLGTLSMGGEPTGIGILGEPTPEPTSQLPAPSPLSEPSTAPEPDPEPAETPTPSTVDIGEYDVYSSTEQDFSFLCEKTASVIWEEENGAAIYPEQINSIPYVLVYSENKLLSNAEKSFQGFTETMRSQYGSDLISVGEFQTYTIGQRQAQGVLYTYQVNDVVIEMLRLLYATPQRSISFTCKAVQGDNKAAMGALALAVTTFEPDAAYYDGRGDDPDDIDKPQQTTSPAALATEAYECDEFTATIPKGWKVSHDVVDAGGGIKRIYLFVQDPDDPNNMFFFVQAMEPFYVSAAAKKAYLPYFPDYFEYAPVLETPTAEETLRIWPSIFTFMQAEGGVLESFFRNYSMQEVLVSKTLEQSDTSATTSYVAATVTIPAEDEPYMMLFQNTLQPMNAPTGLPASAKYYVSYGNNGIVLSQSLVDAQYKTLQSCLQSIDLSGFANKNSAQVQTQTAPVFADVDAASLQ